MFALHQRNSFLSGAAFPDLSRIYPGEQVSIVADFARRGGGRLRKIGPRLYTSNFSEPVEVLARRKGLLIAALYFPGGLVSDRTALTLAPAEDGSIFLIATRGGEIALPGLPRIVPDYDEALGSALDTHFT